MSGFREVEGRRRRAKSSYKDVTKHYVRREAWLPVFQGYSHARKGAVRYLTLCAKGAIDVRYFRQKGVLQHDPDLKAYPTLTFVESDAQDYAVIAETLGKVRLALRGALEEIVLEPTRFPRDHEALRRACPYDIINLDFTGDVVPAKDAPHSATIRTIEKLVEFQRDAGATEWHLFLTFNARKAGANQEAAEDLCGILDGNLGTESLREAYGARLASRILMEREWSEFVRLGVAKFLVFVASGLGYAASLDGSYRYRRREGTAVEYEIVKLIVAFRRVVEIGRLPNPQKALESYSTSVGTIFRSMAVDVVAALKNAQRRDEIARDLEPVLAELQTEGVIW